MNPWIMTDAAVNNVPLDPKDVRFDNCILTDVS